MEKDTTDPFKAKTSEEFFNRAYMVLKDLEIEVSADPVAEGLANFHRRIAEIRKAQNLASKLLFYGIRLKSKIQKTYTSAKILYDAAYATTIRQIPNFEIDDNKKIRVTADSKRIKTESDASVLSAQEILTVNDDQLDEAKSFIEAAKEVNDKLKRTANDLQLSLTTIKYQMLTGEVLLNPEYIKSLRNVMRDELSPDNG